MRVAIRRHDQLLRSTIRAHRGRVRTSKGEGDSFFAEFATAGDAVAAACEIQLALGAESWPPGVDLRVRIALNSGETSARDPRGPVVNRCARLRAAAHPGQTLLTRDTAELCDPLPPQARLQALGKHRLRDLAQPVEIFELQHPRLATGFPPPLTLSRHPHNLPIQPSDFVGRERELAALTHLLPRSRLITLIGAGGSGKTRLAVQLAAEVLDRFPDGAWFVDLSPLADGSLVPQALAAALAVAEPESGDLVDAVAEKLAGERCLLSCLVVLDNCEHLIDRCAVVAERLLSSCSQLSIVATSREPLRVPGELVWRVPPLSLPTGADAAEDSDAVRLFVDRARLSDPGFEPTDLGQISDICRRLDGLPLAIELVAARCGTLPVARLHDQLTSQTALASRRTAVSRQRTLVATVQWSYDLLDRHEKRLFRALAVFAGGFTVEAIAQIAPLDGGDPVPVLPSLIDKSLVQRVEGVQAERYRLLETVRDFVAARLAAAGEEGNVQDRHLRFFVALAERGNVELRGTDQALWLQRLADDHDNFRAALAYGRSSPVERLRLAVALNRFWMLRGHLSEGRQTLAEAIDAVAEPSAMRAEALNALAGMAWNQADLAAAQTFLERSLHDSRQIREPARIQPCLANLGVLAGSRGDFAAADEYYSESLQLAREQGDERAASLVLTNTGKLHAEMGRHPEARSELLESLAIKTRIGDRALLITSLVNLGVASIYSGHLDEARQRFQHALEIVRELNDAVNLVNCLEGLGWVAASQQLPERALQLGAAASALRQAIGAPHTPFSLSQSERWLPAARAALSPDAAEAAWQDGLNMTRQQAAEMALSQEGPVGRVEPPRQ
jgi:predicted ATPase/Tfp pilus assembly protein PilF